MDYDIINKTKENLDKLKQILSINEVLTSAIDIVDDLTNTKIPGYNKTEKANIDNFINVAVEIIHNLQTAKDEDICFDITNFRNTDSTKWTLDKVNELLAILKENLNKITEPTLISKKTELLTEVTLIEKAIENYKTSQNLTLNTKLIEDLVATSIDIIEKANNNKNLPLETFITKAIFNALDKKQPIIQPTPTPVNNNNNQNLTLERLLTKAIFNALDKSQTNSPPVSPSINISSQTKNGIFNNSGKTLQGMFSNSFSFSNKGNYLEILKRNTHNGICEDLNKIVSEIAEKVCKLITEQFANTETGSTSGTGTTKPSGIGSMQQSIPCPIPIPLDYQLLGTYDNTDLRYNDKTNTFCTNNSTQSTPPTDIPIISPTINQAKKIPTNARNPMPSNKNTPTNDLNALVDIAVDLIDNIKNQNTNIHKLVDAAVNIIAEVR